MTRRPLQVSFLTLVLLPQLCLIAYGKILAPITAFLPQHIRLNHPPPRGLRSPVRSTSLSSPTKRAAGGAGGESISVGGHWLSRVRGGGGGGIGSGVGGGGGRGGGGHGQGDGFQGGDDEEGKGNWSAGVAGVMGSLWSQYSQLLQDKPLRTKAITAGVIAILGDLVAQSLEKGWIFNFLTDSKVSKEFDTARSIAVLIDGLVVTGPCLHYLYTFLERVIPSQKGFFAAAIHVAVDELIFDPLFVLGFFFLCGSIEGRDIMRDIVPQVKREYWSALKGGWAVSLLFLPIEFSTFRFLPVHLRVLMVNLTDVMWTAVVSYFSHHHATISPAPGVPAVPVPA